MCIVLGYEAGKAATLVLNLIGLTLFLSLVDEKKKCDLGYRSHVPVYPEYTIIRVSTESYYRESSLSIFYK